MPRKLLTGITLLLILVLLGVGSGIFGLRRTGSLNLPGLVQSLRLSGPNVGPGLPGTTKVVSEESVTIDVVKKVTPAVVTVSITQNQPVDIFPNFGFGPFGLLPPQNQPGPTQQVKQDIGSGFIVSGDGLVVTNKHVVADTSAKYRIITADNKSYDANKIYRDPNNDFAILKINASGLPTVELGDSSHLQVGQFALAIGTALGEFRSTVTTGVVSGIGRDITAGSPYEGSEQLSDIIQTSAAINPGNSGGPLLNSSGQVIGVNVAVASGAQNIGFALPINLLKDSLATFQANGQFAPRAFLGVQYRMVTRDLSILNDIPEGAYVQSVVAGSPAQKAGVEDGDIITRFDGKPIRDSEGGLAKLIAGKKPGDNVALVVYRGDSQTVNVNVTLGESSS